MDSEPKSSKWSWMKFQDFAFLIGIVGLLVVIAIPRVGSGRTKRNRIENNLINIYSAKEAWAIEHGFTNGVQLKGASIALAVKDLAPYLPKSFTTSQEFGNPQYDELYLIRNLNQPAEAVLTKDLTERYASSSLPRGTIIRCVGYNIEIILPDGTRTTR